MFLKIIDRCPGDLIGVLEMFWWISWKYLKGVLRYLMGVAEIFDGYPGDI